MTKKLQLAILFAFMGVFAQAQTISIVGTGVNGWPPDQTGPEITLDTTDNIVYMITGLVLSTGEVKFRQDMMWTTNWGTNSFPTGIGTQDGMNIPTIAGTYDVTFNRSTGAYSFVQGLATKSFDKTLFTVYPNPSNNVWNISAKSTIDKISVVDVSGKHIFVLNPGAETAIINGENLSAGIYFATVRSGKSTQTIKLVRK